MATVVHTRTTNLDAVSATIGTKASLLTVRKIYAKTIAVALFSSITVATTMMLALLASPFGSQEVLAAAMGAGALVILASASITAKAWPFSQKCTPSSLLLEFTFGLVVYSVKAHIQSAPMKPDLRARELHMR